MNIAGAQPFKANFMMQCKLSFNDFYMLISYTPENLDWLGLSHFGSNITIFMQKDFNCKRTPRSSSHFPKDLWKHHFLVCVCVCVWTKNCFVSQKNAFYHHNLIQIINVPNNHGKISLLLFEFNAIALYYRSRWFKFTFVFIFFFQIWNKTLHGFYWND